MSDDWRAEQERSLREIERHQDADQSMGCAFSNWRRTPSGYLKSRIPAKNGDFSIF